MKKIINVKGAKKLSILQQKMISGGFWGCQPQLIQCDSDQDCSCSSCEIIVDGPNGPINFSDVCAF